MSMIEKKEHEMARIAVLVSNPCTSDARVIKMARAAVDAGHEVHVFGTAATGAPLFESLDGVIYHRLEWRPAQVIGAIAPFSWAAKISRFATFALIKRLIPFLKYRMFSKVYAETVASVRPDIIHAHDLICLPAAHDAAKLCNAAVVYDAHELEMHRNPPLPFFQKRWVARTEYKFAVKAAGVNTVGRLVGQVLGRHLGRNDINVLYNSPIIAPCTRHIRADLNLSATTPLLIYVGKVTVGRGVGEIMAVLPKLNGVFFATIGPCDDGTRRILERQAERLDVSKRFRILPPVPFEQVVNYIRGADLGVISVEPVTLSYQYCMPNKLFELSFANVPIISNKLDEIEEFLGEMRNGEIADFEDGAKLPYLIFRMLQQKQNYIMDEAKFKVLQAKYSWDAQAAKLLSVYGAAMEAKRS